MSIDRRCWALLVALSSLACSVTWSQETGQYRSRILLDPLGEIGKGSEMSVDELERQINGIRDPYARSSATRHLARHYVNAGDYPAAIQWYREALAAGGLSDVANREMLRELAQVYLLAEDYRAATRTLEQATALALVPDPADFLLLAQAHYRLGDYVAVVTALDKIQARGLPLDSSQKQQALALYYRAGAFEQCEGLLSQLLEEEPAEARHWHQLVSVYLQQNKRRAAQDQLVLAYEKGIPFTVPERLLLVDLLAVNGNPFGAAQSLEAAIAAGEVPRDAANQRKLFELWLQARERDRARESLAGAARLSGDTELYLYLAQLQLEDEAWPAVEQTVLEACRVTLDDRFVSRANLLLGVSLLKQGREVAARQSFINATLIGGTNAQAADWLTFMAAAPPSERELLGVRGPCVGSQGKRARLDPEVAPTVAVVAPMQPPQPDEIVAQAAPEVISQEPTRYFHVALEEALEANLPQLGSTATRLHVNMVKSGGTANGPLQLLRDSSGNLMLGIPVRGSVQASGRYRVLNAPAYNYVARDIRLDGDVQAQLGDAVTALADAGAALTGELRLVLPSPGDTVLEARFGVD
jgi:tetratricopeptide (TPR) repeat protein